MQRTCELPSLEATLALGVSIGRCLKGGEIIELSGDVGTGKTTLVKGLAQGLDIGDVVQSPTFTISRVYDARNGLALHHYDFYRLKEAGIMRAELAESLDDPKAIVALEWDETVRDLLPGARTLRFEIEYSGEMSRRVQVSVPDELEYVLPALEGADA